MVYLVVVVVLVRRQITVVDDDEEEGEEEEDVYPEKEDLVIVTDQAGVTDIKCVETVVMDTKEIFL